MKHPRPTRLCARFLPLVWAPLSLVPRYTAGAPVVWGADDGTRIRPEAARPPGQVGNSVYRPGGSIRLFGVTGETIAWQIAVRASERALRGVSVTVTTPRTAGGQSLFENWEDTAHPGARPIERFVPFALPVLGRTRSRTAETIGWLGGAARPADADVIGNFPDPLIPVEIAPTWAPYPLVVAPGETGVVWIDLTIPEHASSGTYQGAVVVTTDLDVLGELPLEIEVKEAHLPWASAATAVFYDHRELEERIGDGAAERHLSELLRRHHLTPLFSADDMSDVERLRSILERTADPQRSPDVVALGAFGSLGEPSADNAANALALADRLATASGRPLYVFLYAIDEQCGSDRAARWQHHLGRSHSLPVGETCGERVTERAADLVMVAAQDYVGSVVADARRAGKEVWIYNGARPRAGSLVLDAPAVDLRANGWIASAFAVSRWFYWESTFWGDDNRGGHGAIDVYASTETFHNDRGDTAIGDGVLVYPGRQLRFPAHSLDYDGVIASIRLKNLRRGIEDAAYIALAAKHDPSAVEQIVHDLVPAALDEAGQDAAPAWPGTADAFERARRALWELIPAGSHLDDRRAHQALVELAERREARRPGTRPGPDNACGARGSLLAMPAALVWLVHRKRRRAQAAVRKGASARPGRTEGEYGAANVPPRL